MRVVTSDYLAGVLTNFKVIFAEDFAAARNAPDWGPLAIPMESNGAENQYTWFGTTPKMRKVTKEQLQVKGLNRYNFTIVNEEWQNGIEVDRATLERDNLGLLTPRIRQLGQEAGRHPGELILSLFVDNPVAFDGVVFFENTREIGDSGNIDNILAGTGVTVAAFQTDLGVARAAMRKFKDDEGRPMNVIGNIIVVPPDLEQVVYQALNANQGDIRQQVIPGDQAATQGRGYTVVVDPFLTDVNDWYLCHDGGPTARPFVWQEEKAPEILADTDPNSREAIKSRSFLYSAYGRYNVGPADPRYAVKTTNS